MPHTRRCIRREVRKLAALAFILTCMPMVVASASAPLPGHKPRPEMVKAVTAAGSVTAEELLYFGAIPNVPKPGHKPVANYYSGDYSADLSLADAALYKKIFEFQAAGDMEEADRLISQLQDFRLRGHVLYQRYMHPTSYRSNFSELETWLRHYADHPGAENIYKLALKRMPGDHSGMLPEPVKNRGLHAYLDGGLDHAPVYTSPVKRPAGAADSVNGLQKSVNRDLSHGAPTRAFKRLRSDAAAKLLDAVEYDQLQSVIAKSYMYEGKLDKALALAKASTQRSGNKIPLAGWVGGLVSWRQGQYKQAARFFELTATSPYASRWFLSAGAYWASRAHMRAGNIREVSRWQEKAAQYPRTFYGLIATRSLGWDFDFNWDMPSLTAEEKQQFRDNPAGIRAAALVAAGQYHIAEQELYSMDMGENSNLAGLLLAYAHEAALPALAMRIAESVTRADGGLYDAALFPTTPWEPASGYQIDRALIYALIRQESRFNPTAESHSGATGLMQLMPATAYHVSGNRSFKDRQGRYALMVPETNLDIGQRYVAQLLDQDPVNTELLSMVIAYNAGPGNLKKWKRELAGMERDPLLFIESIPISETRAFVERVMANYWIYRLRMGQPTPSLDAVVEGGWAHYVSFDGVKRAAALPAGIQPSTQKLAANYH